MITLPELFLFCHVDFTACDIYQFYLELVPLVTRKRHSETTSEHGTWRKNARSLMYHERREWKR